MVYLPTFGSFMGQMLVNIPYMEHMGSIFITFQGIQDWSWLQVQATEAVRSPVSFGFNAPHPTYFSALCQNELNRC